ncbi:MAG: hypothetical protein AVDCRST_MAG91-2688 [uncultured Sphingomonadaceae bacterium]|uniref:Uncharacterized protein n=1 Tax=uncultured Sphingomonadaceae bacterium TaxID=169976 RepID=A0A6J4TN77_9SPHN|nr:MAG: hypothetical protein AVDCRST_MAG91-2688 [uncultured Sphingomonadaceae bacterium]
MPSARIPLPSRISITGGDLGTAPALRLSRPGEPRSDSGRPSEKAGVRTLRSGS